MSSNNNSNNALPFQQQSRKLKKKKKKKTLSSLSSSGNPNTNNNNSDENVNRHPASSSDDENNNNNNNNNSTTPRGGLRRIVSTIGGLHHRIGSPRTSSPLRRRRSIASPLSSSSSLRNIVNTSTTADNTPIPNSLLVVGPNTSAVTSASAAAVTTNSNSLTTTTTKATNNDSHHPTSRTQKNFKFPHLLFHRKNSKSSSNGGGGGGGGFTSSVISSFLDGNNSNDITRRNRRRQQQKQNELEQRRVQQQQQQQYTATIAWDWIENDCTIDEIVLKIIAYAGGPRILLHRSEQQQNNCVHQKWIRLLGGISPNSDSSWKILSEELYKLDPNNNNNSSKPINASWKHYYFLNPIVPTDFDTIEDAIEYASYTAETLSCKDYVHYYYNNGNSKSTSSSNFHNSQSRMRYGTTDIDNDDDDDDNNRHHDHSTSSCGSSFSMFAGTYDSSSWLGVYPWHESLGDLDYNIDDANHHNNNTMDESNNNSSVLAPPWKTTSGGGGRGANNNGSVVRYNIGDDPQYTIRVLLQPGMTYYIEQDAIKIPVSHRRSWVHSLIVETINNNNNPSLTMKPKPSAIIQSKFSTRPNPLLMGREPNNNSVHTNCPLFRLMYGSLILRNISLRHECKGNDIWHGNSAIYSPPITSMGASSLQTTLVLDTVSITSHSGRGIVATASDYGNRVAIRINNSLIRSCAATGIYLSTGIVAASMDCSLNDTDIVDNGIGTRQGINRGHSGMYLEGGGYQTIQINNCNISNNETSGICFCTSPSHAPHMQLSILNEDEFDIIPHQDSNTNNNNENNNNNDQDPLSSLLRGIPSNNDNTNNHHHNTPMMIRFGMKNSTIITNKLEQLQVVADTMGIHSHTLYRLYNRMNNEVALLGTQKPRSTILQQHYQYQQRHHHQHHHHHQRHVSPIQQQQQQP